MMIETLKTASELAREQTQKMEQARLFEVLIAEDEQASKALAYYSDVLSRPDPEIEILEAVIAAASKLNSKYVARGESLRVGGYELRSVILFELGHYLTRATAARAAMENKFPEVELRASEAKAALAAFVSKHAA